MINGAKVANATEYKYLGATVINKLNFTMNTSDSMNDRNSTKLRYMGTTKSLINQCYRAFIKSCLLFDITLSSHDMTSRKQQESLRVCKAAAKL